jgi:hypothetical protein
LAVACALAICACGPVAASAHNWIIEGSTLGNGSSAAASLALKTGTTLTLKSKLLGQEFVLTSTTLSSSEALITQSGTAAKGSVTLSLSGLTVDKPAGCTVTSPITTKKLTFEAFTHTGSTHAFDRFFPHAGTVIGTIKVGSCAVAGSYNLTGDIYGETGVWGTANVSQTLVFSPAINATLGGNITIGVSTAELTAEATDALTGSNAGKAWGVEE